MDYLYNSTNQKDLPKKLRCNLGLPEIILWMEPHIITPPSYGNDQERESFIVSQGIKIIRFQNKGFN